MSASIATLYIAAVALFTGATSVILVHRLYRRYKESGLKFGQLLDLDAMFCGMLVILTTSISAFCLSLAVIVLSHFK